MFDNLFSMMGPVCSSVALATVLATLAIVVGVARIVSPRRLARPRF